MHINILRTIILKHLPIIFFVLVAGCAKNGEAVKDTSFTNLEIKTIGVDALQLKVMADETVLTDSLISPAGSRFIPVEYLEPKHRIRLVDIYTDRILMDTMINYKPGFINGVTFFQPAAGANFVWVGPPVNEPLPPTGSVKLSLIYTHPGLPDSVKVVVENYINTTPTTGSYVATDSFQLKRNEFSRYFLGRNDDPANRKAQLKLYTTDQSRVLKGVVDRDKFVQANSDYSIYLFRTHSGTTGGAYTLIADKLY